MATEPAAQLWDVADDPVVREEPPVLLERMGVLRLGSASVAWRMWERKVAERTLSAPVMNVSLRFAATGLRYTVDVPSALKVPSPTPSGWFSLCSSRLVGASSSQNVAWTSRVPPVMPKSRHIGWDLESLSGRA